MVTINRRVTTQIVNMSIIAGLICDDGHVPILYLGLCNCCRHTLLNDVLIFSIGIMTIARSTERFLQKEACDSGGPKGGLPMCARMGAIIDGLGLGVSSGFV